MHREPKSGEHEEEKPLQKRSWTATYSTHCRNRTGDEKEHSDSISYSSAPVSLSRSSSKDHGDSSSSSSGSHRHKRTSSDSEHSIGMHSDEPRSPDLAILRSGPEWSRNNPVVLSLPPSSCTSSLAPSQFHSGERTHSAQSSNQRTERTQLPTKKEPSSTRAICEVMQEQQLATQQTPIMRSSSQTESAGRSRYPFVDLPADMNLKRKSLGSRRVSSESIYLDSSPSKTLSVGGNHSSHRSPGATSPCDILSTNGTIHTGFWSSPSMAVSTDWPRTPPRKRPTLEDNRVIAQGSVSTSQSLVSSNLTSLVSDLVERSQDGGNKLVKRRGKKLSNADRPHISDISSITNSSDQINLTNNPKRDKVADDPPRQLPPLDHVPSMIFQNPEPSQPYARASSGNQLANIHPQFHHILPPCPSITPPPGASPHLSRNYRPPAVIFTIDNRAESRMLTADVRTCIEQFTKNARVIAPPTQSLTSCQSCIHPIGVIMWQSLPDFYKWYTEITGLTAIGSLKFELIDVQWQTEKAIVIPEGNLTYFRILKQYVWDLFWVASNLNNSPSLFQVSISPLPSLGIEVSSTISSRYPVNSSSPLPPLSDRTSPENIFVVAESRNLAALTSSPIQNPRSATFSSLTRRISNIEHILNGKEVDETRSRPSRRSVPSANNHLAGKPSFDASSSSHPPHQSEYFKGPAGPAVNAKRTSWDIESLRNQAHYFLDGRNDVEIFGEESTVHDQLPYKTGTEVCGAFVDRNSGKGLATITGKGFITQNITTGPEETGDRYKQINIKPKQTCMLHGDAVVLYYRRRTHGARLKSLQPITQNQQKSQSTGPYNPSTTSTQSPVEIIVRLQIDGTGKFSAPFDKSVLRPKVNTTEFFSWFSTQTRHWGSQGPHCLKFTFKDAMPAPKATEVLRGNEDHFDYMRKDIKAQFEKAKAYMPDLKEFVILVSVPNWSTPVREEEDW